MADSGVNTTTLVVVAAVAIVAIMWSRRASASQMGGGRPDQSDRAAERPRRDSMIDDARDLIDLAKDIFSGVDEARKTFSSDESSVYTIPTEQTDSGRSFFVPDSAEGYCPGVEEYDPEFGIVCKVS